LIIFIGNFFLIFYLDLELFSLIYNFSIWLFSQKSKF
jgi:hypothetical protein